ncbi:hypothetical protein [Streptomyces vietnamensis]|uniref:Uncharacterized protein n=1 Tax=Streptomyces vietnamensis TaxID=362257 RepID=A0A0B5IAR6_9ACTN|nr:hypothetical protein [Streptomyces vietnamensis]AJF66768.1 hypothetical protein SVTN_22730 [Streptomyces vietnamensis]
MAEVTTEELSVQIAGLNHKLRIVDGGWLPSTNWLRDNLIVPEFKTKFEEMYQELHKELSSELLESWGLDTIGGAVEKFHEDHEHKWAYFWTAIGGILVPLLVASLAIVFRRLLLEGFRKLQIGLTGKAVVLNENQTRFERLTRDQLRDRENNAGGGIASIPQDANFDNLRTQLQQLNPELLKFNNRAPAFTQAFRKLPSDSKATKAASAIKKIADAITGVDHSQMQPVAEGVNKINNAMRHADPKKVEKVAKATDKLKSAMLGFTPTKIPEGAKLEASARGMDSLTTATGTLRTKFNELRQTVRSLDQELGAAGS